MKKTKNKIAFLGSFDPIHIGHIYILQQMLALDYDEYFLIVANNWDKKQSPLKVRKQAILESLKNVDFDCSKLKVVTTSKKMTTYLKENKIDTFIRGYRDQKDLLYEDYLYDTYVKDIPLLKRILLETPDEYKNVRSSSIKEVRQ